jgi:hypothetical protein
VPTVPVFKLAACPVSNHQISPSSEDEDEEPEQDSQVNPGDSDSEVHPRFEFTPRFIPMSTIGRLRPKDVDLILAEVEVEALLGLSFCQVIAVRHKHVICRRTCA